MSSSGGSEERDALGVDLLDGVLWLALVFRSMRPEEIEDAEEDCWDWEWLAARALEDRLGDGGAIEVGCGWVRGIGGGPTAERRRAFGG